MLGRWILRRWAPSIAAALSLLAPPSSAVHAAPPKVAPLSPQEIFKKYSSAVVQVKTVGRSGTGFIDVVGKVFTAYHVVEGASEVSVILSDGRTLTSRRVAGADRVKDIAILETDLPMSFTRPLLGTTRRSRWGSPSP